MAHSQRAEIAFSLSEKDLIPEGIAYDPATKSFYVGSIFKKKIVRVDKSGKATDFVTSGEHGLLEVLGMTVHNGHLYACNNTSEGTDSLSRQSNVHVFDLKNGSLVRRFSVKDGRKHLFNDLCFLDNGDLFVTDSDGGGIYLIKNGSTEIEPFIPEGTFRYPNGITRSENSEKLFVSTGSGEGIVAIDVRSKKLTSLKHPKYLIIGTDGLYQYKQHLIGIQNVLFPESVLQFTPSADLNSMEEIEFLLESHPRLNTPTTGVIVGDEFYFIGNSQLLQLIGNNGQIKNPHELTDTFILKIKLTADRSPNEKH